MPENKIEKHRSQEDHRNYKYVVLDNGIKVLLISD